LIQKGKDLNQFRSFSITAEQEFRKRAKLRVGDLIEVEGYKIRIE
jgi:ribosome-associated protein YbcJ (S4-like RNA binding protein)